jgi:hypothetical protein
MGKIPFENAAQLILSALFLESQQKDHIRWKMCFVYFAFYFIIKDTISFISICFSLWSFARFHSFFPV